MTAVALFFLLLAGDPGASRGWRDLKWGASEAEVLQKYPAAKGSITKVAGGLRRASMKGSAASYPAEIVFSFDDKGLAAVAVLVKAPDTLIACRDLASLLEKKYGASSEHCPTGTTDYIHIATSTMIRLECEPSEIVLTYSRWSAPSPAAASVSDADALRMRDL